MPQNCLLAYISIEWRKILSTPPFLEEPPPKWQPPPFKWQRPRPPPYLPILKLSNPPLNLGGDRNYVKTIRSFTLQIFLYFNKSFLIQWNPATMRVYLCRIDLFWKKTHKVELRCNEACLTVILTVTPSLKSRFKCFAILLHFCRECYKKTDEAQFRKKIQEKGEIPIRVFWGLLVFSRKWIKASLNLLC